MALRLGFAYLTGKSAGAAENATRRHFFRGRALRQSCRISSDSTLSVSALSCRCQKSVEKLFGAKGAVYVCSDHSGIYSEELSSLLAASNQNCEQFPRFRDDGTVVPVDPAKLRRALRHSTVVVALYVDGGEDNEFGVNGYSQVSEKPVRGWLDYWRPRHGDKRRMVAFGRATSDVTLTASIYDLVVAPSYQRSGYGSRVLLRIVRKFFEKCGFTPDQLKSTTMMYTRGPTSISQVASEVKEYGRKMFLIPPPLTPRISTWILEKSRL